MDKDRIEYLLHRFAQSQLTLEERQEIEHLLSQPDREELEAMINALIEQQGQQQTPTVSNEASAQTFQNIIQADKTAVPLRQPLLRRIGVRWMSVAALLLLTLGAGTWFLLNRPAQQQVVRQEKPRLPEKDPGSNKARLTLSDGSVMELDSLGNGVVAKQGGTEVMLNNGQLAYDPQGEEQPATIAYNTITTPKGGEFTITLPDGTKVWLNAASSLRFPTQFAGSKRTVELTGEAYLEVAEDKQHPFTVSIRNIEVAVLGTQFNINGYEDESSIVTTLVSGSVRVTAPGNQEHMLVPGEHAVVDNDRGAVIVEKADVDEETAWKNGRTYFNGVNIRQIMRQVARWYNVEVKYEGNVANKDFTCTVARKDKLSRLLNLLELTGAVHFTMEGNTIIVH